MNKATRDHMRAIETALAPMGARIASFKHDGGGHPQLLIVLRSGRQFKFSAVGTPSDKRSRLNDISDAKRRVRELSNG